MLKLAQWKCGTAIISWIRRYITPVGFFECDGEVIQQGELKLHRFLPIERNSPYSLPKPTIEAGRNYQLLLILLAKDRLWAKAGLEFRGISWNCPGSERRRIWHGNNKSKVESEPIKTEILVSGADFKYAFDKKKTAWWWNPSIKRTGNDEIAT